MLNKQNLRYLEKEARYPCKKETVMSSSDVSSLVWFSPIRSQLICEQPLRANRGSAVSPTSRWVLPTLVNPLLVVFETFLTKTDQLLAEKKYDIYFPRLVGYSSTS